MYPHNSVLTWGTFTADLIVAKMTGVKWPLDPHSDVQWSDEVVSRLESSGHTSVSCCVRRCFAPSSTRLDVPLEASQQLCVLPAWCCCLVFFPPWFPHFYRGWVGHVVKWLCVFIVNVRLNLKSAHSVFSSWNWPDASHPCLTSCLVQSALCDLARTLHRAERSNASWTLLNLTTSGGNSNFD